MATGRVPTTANSPLTAKGDLFGYSTTQARVAVGSDGETLVADSSASTGLRYQSSITGGKNFAINGGMDIWQRGTTFTSTGPTYQAYTTDRWTCYAQGAGTISQDTSLSASGFRYGLKFTSSAASGGNDFYQLIETDQTVPLAGKQVAVSGYCLAPNGKTPLLNLEYSTTVNDGLFGTYVQCTATTISQPTATGSLLRYTYSFAVPTTAKTLRLRASTGTLNNTEASTWTGIQVEVGNVPTAFSRAGGTIQGELAACQRYYTRESVTTTYAYFRSSGNATNTTQARIIVPLPVQMRTKPAAMDTGGSLAVSDGVNLYTTGSFVLSANSTTQNAQVEYTHGSAVFTQFRYESLQDNNNGATYLGFSAEL